MARKITTEKTVLIDDLDFSEGATTIRFALEDKTYEIDLSPENAARLRDALTEFIQAARYA